MSFLEAVRMALRTIRAQKLKSFFSLVGVLIGVTFLIAVVSIVQGMNRYMVERFANTLVGANTFELRQRPIAEAAYYQESWRPTPRLLAEAGLRAEHVSGRGWTGLSPRASVKWFVTPDLAVVPS
jgi:putative ABC transport system permease protein